MKRLRLLCATAALAAVLSTCGPAAAGPILEASGGSVIQSGSPGDSVGWSFTTGSSAIQVTALDAALQIPDASHNVTSTQVRLYNAAQVTLASATVSTSDPTEGSPIVFNSHTLTMPVTLAANTTYYIAEDAPQAQLTYLVNTNAPTTSLGITYGAGVLAFALGQNPTSDPFGTTFDPGYFGPDFDARFVPEPSALSLGAVGAAGLLAYAVRRRRVAA